MAVRREGTTFSRAVTIALLMGLQPRSPAAWPVFKPALSFLGSLEGARYIVPLLRVYASHAETLNRLDDGQLSLTEMQRNPKLTPIK